MRMNGMMAAALGIAGAFVFLAALAIGMGNGPDTAIFFAAITPAVMLPLILSNSKKKTGICTRKSA